MGHPLDLTVPIFTEKRTSRDYVARPLLIGKPEAKRPRYREALRRCAKKIKRKIPEVANREHLESLLWYGFNPDLTVRTMELTFNSGQRLVSGPYTVVWFEIDDIRYVCLPGFDHHLFVPRQAESGEYDMREEVIRTIQFLLREKRSAGQSINHEAYQASKRDDVTEIRLLEYVEFEPFSFTSASGADLSFEGLLGSVMETFRGRIEMARVAEDVNERYPGDLDRAVFREDTVEQVRNSLYRGDPTATVLVGPPSVGKTAVLQEAIYRHLEDATEDSLNDFRQLARQPKVWALAPSRVIAGMSQVGQWQRRLESILSFAKNRLSDRYSIQKSDILYVDNLVALLRLGQSAQSDLTLADVLKPHLEEDRLPFIGEATPDVWTRVQEIDQRFADLFSVIRLPEPPPSTAWRITARYRSQLEKDRKAHITIEALQRLKDLQTSFASRRAMPGRAAEALDRLVTRHGREPIEAGSVDDLFLDRTKMRPEVADDDTSISPSSVRDFIEDRLIGQPDATDCLIDTVSVAKARLSDPSSPVASMMFIGPTGVGKTEAAKVLREYLFTDAECFLRFNMNEYVDEGAVARLVGDLQDPEGHLTNKVRFQPSAVVLLDEIEKAHPSVHNLLLQVLDDGRLTDGMGRAVDFTQTVIIMTSNLGAEEAASAIGFGREEQEKEAVYRSAVEDFFRPEFVNRIDRIVSFQPLDLESIKQIAQLEIQQFLQRDGFTRRTTVLNLSDRALNRVAEDGFDPDLGGRALKRSIERNVAPLIADHLVQIGADDPVVLDLFLREGTLHPRVTSLSVTDETVEDPRLLESGPSEKEAVASFYETLRDRVDDLRADFLDEEQEELVYTESEDEEDELQAPPAFLLYKDRVRRLYRDLKQLTKDVNADLPSTKLLSLTLRSPTNEEKWPPGWNEVTHGRPNPSQFYKAYFRELDIREHLEQVYANAGRALRQAPEETVQRYVETASLDFLRPAFADEIGEQGPRIEEEDPEPNASCMHIRSLVEGRGREFVEYLRERFERVAQIFYPSLESFDVLLEDENELYLHLPIPRMNTFYQPEAGVHFFFEAYGGALPVHVRLMDIPADDSPEEVAQADHAAREEWVRRFEAGETDETGDPASPDTIVRFYTPPGAGQEGTVTDLRTGLMDRYDANRYSWFLWMYRALPEDTQMPVPEVG